MAYITREDGTRFVVPSYRDVLTVKQKSQLKRDILLLAQNYGEYITLQKKTPTQYEVAFSTETGYLLGESVWNYFKRPDDMIYCEKLPNSNEAILVIVKSGSVYLDGSFPLENINEELIIFLTQENHFEIYTAGDVPISETPMDGKFTFEPSSVKSFSALPEPIFNTLPLVKSYQLQLVDTVLKANGIGTLSLTPILAVAAVVVVGFLAYTYYESRPPPVQQQQQVNPYQGFYDALTSPQPDEELVGFADKMKVLLNIPGWSLGKVSYSSGSFSAYVQSPGSKIEALTEWAKAHDASVQIQSDGIYVSTSANLTTRDAPTKIYPLREILTRFIDDVADVYPGNHLTMGTYESKGVYRDVTISIGLDQVSPSIIYLLSKQLKDLPFVLQSIDVTVNNGTLTGSINLEALGS